MKQRISFKYIVFSGFLLLLLLLIISFAYFVFLFFKLFFSFKKKERRKMFRKRPARVLTLVGFRMKKKK